MCGAQNNKIYENKFEIALSINYNQKVQKNIDVLASIKKLFISLIVKSERLRMQACMMFYVYVSTGDTILYNKYTNDHTTIQYNKIKRERTNRHYVRNMKSRSFLYIPSVDWNVSKI